MEPQEYFIRWRENFNDEEGWFTKDQAKELVRRIHDSKEEDIGGELDIYCVIKGQDVSGEFGV